MVKFLRRVGSRFSKLGKGRKKKQKWRRPTGRDNKMREKRRGYPAVVKIGYKQDKKLSGIINDTLKGTPKEGARTSYEASKKPVMIMNVKDLEKIKKNEIGIIGSIGKKKKIEIAKIAKAKQIKIYNLNAGKFLKELERKNKKTKEEDVSKTKKVDKEKNEKAAPKGVPSVREDINTESKNKIKEKKK